jgi:hypothetical protein
MPGHRRGHSCNTPDYYTELYKTKLLTEYESVTQKVSLPVESILQNAKQLQHERLPYSVSSFILLFPV